MTELKGLWLDSIERNEAAGLTGALLYTGEDFVHVLEGEEPTVRRMIDTVKADPRHADLRRIVEADIVSRRFGMWPLKLMNIQDSTVLCDRFSRDEFLHDNRVVRQEALFAMVRI